MMDDTIQYINHDPMDYWINFDGDGTYPVDNDLSEGQRYPTFEQMWQD